MNSDFSPFARLNFVVAQNRASIVNFRQIVTQLLDRLPHMEEEGHDVSDLKAMLRRRRKKFFH